MFFAFFETGTQLVFAVQVEHGQRPAGTICYDRQRVKTEYDTFASGAERAGPVARLPWRWRTR